MSHTNNAAAHICTCSSEYPSLLCTAYMARKSLRKYAAAQLADAAGLRDLACITGDTEWMRVSVGPELEGHETGKLVNAAIAAHEL